MADSIVFGSMAMAIALTCLAMALLKRGVHSESPLLAIAGFMWIIGAPVLALLNLFFVARDFKGGRWRQAAIGLLLSAGTFAAAWGPVLLPGLRD